MTETERRATVYNQHQIKREATIAVGALDPGVPYESRWAPYVRVHGPGQGQFPKGSIRPRGYMAPDARRSFADANVTTKRRNHQRRLPSHLGRRPCERTQGPITPKHRSCEGLRPQRLKSQRPVVMGPGEVDPVLRTTGSGFLSGTAAVRSSQ